jgi:hypothetical protein
MQKAAEYLDRLATANNMSCTAHVNEIAKGDPDIIQRERIPKPKAPKKAKKNKN